MQRHSCRSPEHLQPILDNSLDHRQPDFLYEDASKNFECFLQRQAQLFDGLEVGGRGSKGTTWRLSVVEEAFPLPDRAGRVLITPGRGGGQSQ